MLIPEEKARHKMIERRNKYVMGKDREEDEEDQEEAEESSCDEEGDDSDGDSSESISEKSRRTSESAFRGAKRLRMRYATCEHCDEEFDVTRNGENDCTWHPGTHLR